MTAKRRNNKSPADAGLLLLTQETLSIADQADLASLPALHDLQDLDEQPEALRHVLHIADVQHVGRLRSGIIPSMYACHSEMPLQPRHVPEQEE